MSNGESRFSRLLSLFDPFGGPGPNYFERKRAKATTYAVRRLRGTPGISDKEVERGVGGFSTGYIDLGRSEVEVAHRMMQSNPSLGVPDLADQEAGRNKTVAKRRTAIGFSIAFPALAVNLGADLLNIFTNFESHLSQAITLPAGTAISVASLIGFTMLISGVVKGARADKLLTRPL